jgi:hypothetical protein
MDSNTMLQPSACSGTSPVVATRVPENERDHFLYRQMGGSFLLFEHAVYAMLEHASEDYSGGTWEFYALSNGGFYMAPCADLPLRICSFGNGFEGLLSPDAAGIFACAMALSHLSFRLRDENTSSKFHLLREFHGDHPEAAALFRALD